MKLLEKYQEEAAEDVKIDPVIIQDKQMMLPSIKHKWVARLIQSKYAIKRLDRDRKIAIDGIVEQLKTKSKVGLSDPSAIAAARKHHSIIKISDDIEEMELIVLYLEKVEKLFASMTWDYKNIVDLVKMETLG